MVLHILDMLINTTYLVSEVSEVSKSLDLATVVEKLLQYGTPQVMTDLQWLFCHLLAADQQFLEELLLNFGFWEWFNRHFQKDFLDRPFSQELDNAAIKLMYSLVKNEFQVLNSEVWELFI